MPILSVCHTEDLVFIVWNVESPVWWWWWLQHSQRWHWKGKPETAGSREKEKVIPRLGQTPLKATRSENLALLLPFQTSHLIFCRALVVTQQCSRSDPVMFIPLKGWNVVDWYCCLCALCSARHTLFAHYWNGCVLTSQHCFPLFSIFIFFETSCYYRLPDSKATNRAHFELDFLKDQHHCYLHTLSESMLALHW